MFTTRPGSSVGRAPPRIGVVPGSIPGQATFALRTGGSKAKSGDSEQGNTRRAVAGSETSKVVKPLRIRVTGDQGRCQTVMRVRV